MAPCMRALIKLAGVTLGKRSGYGRGYLGSCDRSCPLLGVLSAGQRAFQRKRSPNT